MKSTGDPGRAVNDARSDTFFLLRSVFTICRYKQASSKHIQNKAFPTRDPQLQPQDAPLPNRAPHVAPAVTCPSSVGMQAQWGGVHTRLSHVHSPRTQTKQCVYSGTERDVPATKQPRDRPRRLHRICSHTLYK